MMNSDPQIPSPESLTVLVVDDSNEIRMLTGLAMKRFGIQSVYYAVDGREAINIFEKVRPQVVLLDNMLPYVSGLEVLRQIRQIDPSVCVVMISAIATPAIVEEAKSLGAKEYLLKPFSPRKLIDTIKKSLGHAS